MLGYFHTHTHTQCVYNLRGGSTGGAGRAIAHSISFYLYENLFENCKKNRVVYICINDMMGGVSLPTGQSVSQA